MYINIPALQRFLKEEFNLHELGKDYTMNIDYENDVIRILPIGQVEEITIKMEVSDEDELDQEYIQ